MCMRACELCAFFAKGMEPENECPKMITDKVSNTVSCFAVCVCFGVRGCIWIVYYKAYVYYKCMLEFMWNVISVL